MTNRIIGFENSKVPANVTLSAGQYNTSVARNGGTCYRYLSGSPVANIASTGANFGASDFYIGLSFWFRYGALSGGGAISVLSNLAYTGGTGSSFGLRITSSTTYTVGASAGVSMITKVMGSALVVGTWYNARLAVYRVAGGNVFADAEINGNAASGNLPYTSGSSGSVTVNGGGANTDWALDDIIVQDSTGAIDNSGLPPVVTIRAVACTGDGSINNFTTTGGASSRADALANIDAKYCVAPTIGNQQNMTVTAPPGSATDCRGINIYTSANREVGAPASLENGVSFGGAEVAAGTLGLGFTFADYISSLYYKTGAVRISTADATSMQNYFKNV